VALLSANFIFDLSTDFSQHTYYFSHIITDEARVHLLQCLARQMQIQQIVITQVHQHTQCASLPHGQCLGVALEKPFYEEIVFQQSPAASPSELAQSALVQQLVFVLHEWCALNGSVNHHFLDLANGFGGVQALGADIDAVHDAVATEQAVGVF
jgi:hypothetical protein